MQREKGVRSMDDTQIVALYWARDEAALAESERKYGGYCRAFALGMLRAGRTRRSRTFCCGDYPNGLSGPEYWVLVRHQE